MRLEEILKQSFPDYGISIAENGLIIAGLLTDIDRTESAITFRFSDGHILGTTAKRRSWLPTGVCSWSIQRQDMVHTVKNRVILIHSESDIAYRYGYAAYHSPRIRLIPNMDTEIFLGNDDADLYECEDVRLLHDEKIPFGSSP